jgi:hypothetical protein
MRRDVLGLGFMLLMMPASALAQVQASASDTVAVAHGTPDADGHSVVASALKVFLDCKDKTPCYSDYVRTEVAYVDYVNVREAANVHVLITSLGTGAGGQEFTFKFVGLGQFSGVNDEVLYVTRPTDTEELARRGFVQTLKLGLVRYALHTALGSQLVVMHEPTDSGGTANVASRVVNDPWNNWVFRLQATATGEIESSSDSRQYNVRFSTNRVTDAWKFSLSSFVDRRENKYTYSDGSTYTSTRSSYDATVQAIKSLTPHWSAGGKTFISRSTYENKDRVLNALAAVEFSVFPYSATTRRQLTFQYMLGMTGFRYIEETVYLKMHETVGIHFFRTAFDLRETWGSLSANVDLAQYLHDTSKYRSTLSTEGDVRLFKGLALNFTAKTSRIHDQLYLPKGDATDEEVLARQRQLATSYQHSFKLGFSYTFGSIFSNVVNTRLSNFIGGG